LAAGCRGQCKPGGQGRVQPALRAMKLFNQVIASGNTELINIVLGNLEAVAGMLGNGE